MEGEERSRGRNSFVGGCSCCQASAKLLQCHPRSRFASRLVPAQDLDGGKEQSCSCYPFSTVHRRSSSLPSRVSFLFKGVDLAHSSSDFLVSHLLGRRLLLECHLLCLQAPYLLLRRFFLVMIALTITVLLVYALHSLPPDHLHLLPLAIRQTIWYPRPPSVL